MKFYSNGKLLITGEYAVLDGALTFALPTKFGQSLEYESNDSHILNWKSYDDLNSEWFQVQIELGNHLRVIETSDVEKAKTLVEILTTARNFNPDFLQKGAVVKTELTFPRNWGLGTSSTLINNIASWAKIDAFQLLWNSFKGSGYDIACAQNNTAITYQIQDQKPVIQPLDFKPTFSDQLYFVHLNQKQDSKEGIQHYRALKTDKNELIQKISALSMAATNSVSLSDFEEIIDEHENLISNFLQLKKVKNLFFEDYWGSIKSLGAWGGDFILATGNENTPAYFKKKGFETVLTYQEMIL
ncbi:Mevalonate kinase [Pustulibacterium marinum]|uniref:Mevalonate kinase n=1 Tax=Pustulibacterium marinum TaxID=1224947 RepID=A0A1I7EUY4_9FLAO|nr:GYDIA family GHMP kinase [Pustulibacterium marinum]SFU27736.1 Mevalonate kinase [Pustulibacterium marinum]